MIHTTTTAAAMLGCHRETVRRIAERLELGTRIRGGIALLPDEVEAIRAEIRPVGCPKMVAGNKLWKRRKKSAAKRR